VGIILSSQQLYEVEKASDQVIFLKNGIQKNLHSTVTEGYREETPLVIEFESEWTQSKLNDILQPQGLMSLQFNGGTYIATFPETLGMHDFMKIIITNNVPVAYMRNITHSTRRFFVS
jgi:ABC-2 type transport system ATP-binding protein